jgi:PAS domain S-box-containing protein
MNTRKLKIVFIINVLLLSFLSSLYSQKNDIKFDRLSTKEGIPHSTVFSIIQDSKGFLWFGTRNGIARYDGYNFKIFQHNPLDTTSLSDNDAGGIIEDSFGNIWIRTWGGGLNRFNPETEKFTHYKHNPNNSKSISSDQVQSLYINHSGTLWIGTFNTGLNRFDSKSETFIHYRNDVNNPRSISNNRVWSMEEDSKNFWIGTDDGLNKMDRETGIFTFYKNDPNNPKSISHNRVRAIYYSKSGKLWIGTEKGFSLFNPEKDEFTNFIHDSNNPNSLSDNVINDGGLYEDESGILWIGTVNGGLNKFDPKTGKFIRYLNDLNNPKSISYSDVRVIFEDRSHNIWLGTRGGGISKFDNKPKRFEHYSYQPDNPNSLSSNTVYSIFEDRFGILWIGTWSGGLNQFDRKTHKFRHYKPDPNNKNSLSDIDVNVVYEDNAGTLWVGTWAGGLNKLDPVTKEFVHYKYEPNNSNSVSDKNIFSIYEDKSGNFWVGTREGGLNKMDRETGQFKHYKFDPNNSNSISNNTVNVIYEDSQDIMWIGTDDGLNKFDRQLENFKIYKPDLNNPNGINHNRIMSIYEDKSGRLWIGTRGGGLNMMSEGRKMKDDVVFTHYTEKDGLSSNVILGILEDNEGNLWLSTNKGISKFNTQTKIFRNYDVDDGLQGNDFNNGAYFKNRNGKMFFGGTNGFNSFLPNLVKDNPHIPPIVITAFKKFDKDVEFDKALNFIEIIKLSYEDNFFSFEFSALDYTNPSKNQYAYKLEGFDEDWIPSGTKRYATYTNLNPGNYIFRVKGSNNDGIWNEEGTFIKVSIVPPFWQTWWFRIFVIASIIMIAFVIHKGRIKFIELQKQKLEIQVIERTKELQEEQERFLKLSEASFEGIVIHKNGIILDANRMFAQMLGYELPEIIGKHGLDFVAPESRDLASKNLLAGSEEPFEIVGIKKDGSTFLAEVHGKAITYRGHRAGVIAIRDVTERKLAEESLRESEERLSGILELASDAIISVNEFQRIIVFNRTAEHIFGFSANEIIGKSLDILIPERFQKEHINYVQQFGRFGITQRGMGRSREIIGRRKDGEEFPAEASISRFDVSGQKVLTVVLRDITERKKILEALLASEEKFRALADTANDAIVSADSTGSITYFNKGAERIFKYFSNEVMGKPLTILMPEKFHEAHRNGFSRFLSTGEVRVIGKVVELEGRKKDGSDFPMELSLATWKKEKEILFTGIIRDITERKKMIEALNHSNIKLEKILKELKDTQVQLVHSEKMAGLGKISAGMAHEINNPINFIYANIPHLENYITEFKNLISDSEKLLSEPSKQEFSKIKIEKDFEFIVKDVENLLKGYRDGAERIKNIITDLKSFSRLDEAQLKEVDIRSGIESSLTFLLSQYHDKLIVHKEYSTLPKINCYAGQLNQVFMNLLINAAQAIEERNKLEKREKGNIWIKTEVVNENIKLQIANSKIVRISIKDDGVGIPTEIREKIFDPFFTTRPVGKGTGLGLSVSYSIIEKHKGKIYFNTEVGIETEFIIELPV